jgi:hypothetical protein
MCICTTRDIKASLRSEQQEVYDEDPEEEEKNNFRCVLDFQTNVDVAFTWMQYVNHFEEWKFKKLNVAAPEGEHRWIPKFTGVMGGRKNGGCVLDDEGSALYERVKTWMAQFKITRTTRKETLQQHEPSIWVNKGCEAQEEGHTRRS